jgi:hypothetical protein
LAPQEGPVAVVSAKDQAQANHDHHFYHSSRYLDDLSLRHTLLRLPLPTTFKGDQFQQALDSVGQGAPRALHDYDWIEMALHTHHPETAPDPSVLEQKESAAATTSTANVTHQPGHVGDASDESGQGPSTDDPVEQAADWVTHICFVWR